MKKNKNEIKYDNALLFFHCKNCIDQFLESPLHELMTPKEYGQYEVSLHSGENGNIVAVWCKRCGKEVWDSTKLVNGKLLI